MLSGNSGIADVGVTSAATAVCEDDSAEAGPTEPEGVRLGDDFRSLQTNLTFLNTIRQSSFTKKGCYVGH